MRKRYLRYAARSVNSVPSGALIVRSGSVRRRWKERAKTQPRSVAGGSGGANPSQSLFSSCTRPHLPRSAVTGPTRQKWKDTSDFGALRRGHVAQSRGHTLQLITLSRPRRGAGIAHIAIGCCGHSYRRLSKQDELLHEHRGFGDGPAGGLGLFVRVVAGSNAVRSLVLPHISSSLQQNGERTMTKQARPAHVFRGRGGAENGLACRRRLRQLTQHSRPPFSAAVLCVGVSSSPPSSLLHPLVGPRLLSPFCPAPSDEREGVR